MRQTADTADTGTGADWRDFDARHVWHPYTQMALAPTAIAVRSARGAELHTVDGATIIDAISSWWVTLHGHAHPAIVDAVARQAATLEQVIFAGFTHEPASRLAARLAALLPGDIDRVFYSDDGSTAVEVALKMCVQAWSVRGQDRRTFLALEHAYHGDTFGAMSVSARSVFTQRFDDMLFPVERLPFPADAEREERMLNDASVALQRGHVAGIIVEPLLLGAGGMKMWRAETLARLAALAAAHNVPLIADEVLTGFGRTGRMFAVEHAAVVPDIICLSKGLTGGFMPLGVTACRPWLYESFLSQDRTLTLFHGHSFTGNPMACAASLASLDLFEREASLERVEQISRIHRERLDRLRHRRGTAAHRVLGSVAAFDLVDERPGYLNTRGAPLAAAALERGVLLRPLGNVIYLLPPFCITPDQLHHCYDVIERSLPD